jgi:hypothetical protein
VTARDAWKTLEDHYGRVNLGSQHVIQQSLYSLQMKNTADASNYVGQHSVLHECLLYMGVIYTDAEVVFQLLYGLSQTGTWPQFKALLTLILPVHTPVVTTTTTVTTTTGSASTAATARATTTVGLSVSLPSASTFDTCVTHISVEAACLIDEYALTGGTSGLEYVNAVITSFNTTTRNINTITSLHKHHHNPEEVFCTTVSFNKGDHDHVHCYTKGSGMEGQAPWMKGKKKDKEKELAAVAITSLASAPAPVTLPPSTVIAALSGTEAAAESYLADLSCASIVEVSNTPYHMETAVLSCIVAAGFNTILNSGTMTTLMQDCSYFWSYSTANAITVCTVNHISLSTSGHGDCVAMLMIGGNKHHI